MAGEVLVGLVEIRLIAQVGVTVPTCPQLVRKRNLICADFDTREVLIRALHPVGLRFVEADGHISQKNRNRCPASDFWSIHCNAATARTHP